ncbi:MAG: hypothetical protein LUQ04_09930 [Methanoregula sp.]|nr:hypothetical protein [Methanoregula sp.]
MQQLFRTENDQFIPDRSPLCRSSGKKAAGSCRESEKEGERSSTSHRYPLLSVIAG